MDNDSFDLGDFMDNDSFDLGGTKGLQNFNTSIILLLFVAGVPWNAVVIGIIVRQRLFTAPSMMLMLNLAIVNFFVCLFVYPPTIGFSIQLSKQDFIITRRNIDVGTQVCQSGILLVLLPLLSIYTIALMAVDRMMYLAKPLRYKQIITKWKMFTAIVIMWVVCIAISLPPLFGFGTVGFARGYICLTFIASSLDRIYLLLIIILIAIPTLVEVVACAVMIYIARGAIMKRLRRTGLPKGSKQYKQSQLQLIKVFAAILSTSILTYIPLVILGVVVVATSAARVSDYFTTVAYTSVLSRSVLHPIVESYLAKKIRDVISGFFRSRMQWCKSCCHKKTHTHRKNVSDEVLEAGERNCDSTNSQQDLAGHYSIFQDQ